ncbi:hypothetical protein B0O99DRAFT_600359 [Bisporella sp. PMI_857]|nr:hypothetical protein B0O99DRAFT_600359 [Bisporella sp. PMI_857]
MPASVLSRPASSLSPLPFRSSTIGINFPIWFAEFSISKMIADNFFELNESVLLADRKNDIIIRHNAVVFLAVAEACKKPLYPVSAGDLGTNAEDVDKCLKLILELSQRWDSVLLLDETDVFLQKRDNTSIKRNVVASILLRHIEYFQGMLFLTTNRIDDCDPAFENMNFDLRRKIWSTFIQRSLKCAGAFSPITAGDLDDLARHKYNGRQTNNLVANALSIARAKKAEICMGCIRR